MNVVVTIDDMQSLQCLYTRHTSWSALSVEIRHFRGRLIMPSACITFYLLSVSPDQKEGHAKYQSTYIVRINVYVHAFEYCIR